MSEDCAYCRQWNHDHPDAAPKESCGPCDVCQADGHVKAHPRQPTSICLCQRHWNELNADGYHFELYHLIYLIISVIVAIQVYPLAARLFSG
jgi:hypothetical protein